MKRISGRVLMAALLAVLASLSVSTAWGAPGQTPVPGFTPEEVAAAKKNPFYESIYKAKSVVVATLDKVVQGPTTMSQPPTSTMTLTLTVETVLRGPLMAKQQMTFGYSVRGPGFGPQLGPNGNPLGTPMAKVGRNAEFDSRLRPAGSPLGGISANTPALVLGKQYVVAQGGSPGFIGEASEEQLLRVARIATAEANQADAAELALARAKPTEHALYKPLKAADGVVVASIDLGGIVGFDKRGFSRFPEVCVAGLKGGLKRGDRFQALFPPSVAPQGKLPDADFLILGYKQVAAGRYEVTTAVEASEANLLVAAAATGTAELAPKDLKPIEPPPRRPDGHAAPRAPRPTSAPSLPFRAHAN